MKVRLVGLVALCCALTLIVGWSGWNSSLSQTQKASNGTGNGTGLPQAEQDLLTEINQVRAHPGTYATYLENLKPLFKGNEYRAAGRPALMTQEGWAAVDDAIKFLRAAQAVAPLTASAGLNLAAQVHIKDQGGSGSTGHQGSNSSLIEQRRLCGGLVMTIWQQPACGDTKSVGDPQQHIHGQAARTLLPACHRRTLNAQTRSEIGLLDRIAEPQRPHLRTNLCIIVD